MSVPWEDPRVEEGLRRQLARRRRMLEGGAVGVGWKVGFGAPSSLELMQVTAPLLGYLTDATVFQSGVTIEVGDWVRGIVEFEVAVYLGGDLGPGASADEARAAISAVGPAIELADIDLPLEAANVAEILAGDIFHKGVIFGEADPDRAGLDISGLVARILVDGKERAVTSDLEALTGDYPSIVATVANSLVANGERLRAGDVIITGSVIPPLPLAEGTEFAFFLAPFDPISVRAG